VSNHNNPELQRAEKAVSDAEAAVDSARAVVGDLEKKRAACVHRRFSGPSSLSRFRKS
jgi:hypothetical protein